MREREPRAVIALIAAVVIFGTIGIFRRWIPLPSEVLACARGFMGSVFLWLVMKGRGGRFDAAAIRKSAKYLVLTGVMIGLNWILLFEAYNYTSVAAATLCYYMQPVIVILASPFLFKEKMTLRKGICVVLAVTGMLFVSGVFDGPAGGGSAKGILLGLGAAVLYAGVVLTNKRVTGVPVYEKTILQLASAAAVMVPYMLVTGTVKWYPLKAVEVLCLVVVGIVHTGIAYALYFWAIERIPAQTTALLSYLDPVTAILLSAALLHEKLTIFGIIGAVLILGSAAASEIRGK